MHHVIDIHLNSGSGVVKCIQLSTLQNLEQALSAAFTEKCCQISLFTRLARGKRARWTHLIMQFISIVVLIPILYTSSLHKYWHQYRYQYQYRWNPTSIWHDRSTRPNCKGSPILLDCKMSSSLPLQRESYAQCNR